MTRLAVLLLCLAACGSDPDYLSVEELMDPTACMDCHPSHYREWSGSMHAYAADDPVFLAMNQRGQEDTNGELGDFCVNCHAPMAVRLGLTTDGLNLADVPQYAKGVTCFFCHSVDEVTGDHDNPLTLASDQVLRAGIANPVEAPGHRKGYSELIAGASRASSAMCGSCHDVVTPAGVHLEQTFAEWEETIFASDDPRQHLSCGQCHMAARTDVAAEVDGVDVPLRSFGVHDHKFAAVDSALIPWPEMEAQAEARRLVRSSAVLPRICVSPTDGGRLDYRLDNIGAGHMLPTGVAHDRRLWAELHVYDAAGNELWSTGVVSDGEDPPTGDPDLWELREFAYDDEGNPVKYFWEVREIVPSLLAPTVTLDPLDPRFDHSSTRSWSVAAFYPQIARVTAVVRQRALPYEILDDLGLDFDLETDSMAELEWTSQLADLGGCVNP